MGQYVLQRLVSIVPVLLGVSIIVFGFMSFIPGDAAELLAGPTATRSEIESARRSLGLDQPLHIRYVSWLGRAVQGDFGYSVAEREPILPLIISKFGNTLVLAVGSIGLSMIFGLAAGVLSAMRRGSWIDRGVMVLSLLGTSTPSFWLGLVFILIFSLTFGLFPTVGMRSVRGTSDILDVAHHLVLPSMTLGMVSMAIIARVARSSMLEVLQQDYMRTAHAKGLAVQIVMSRHALRNALLPVITVAGIQMGYLLGGSILVETVFSWPGLGLQLYRAISTRDVPLVQGGILLVSTTFVFINLFVDILYRVVDPRLRYE